MNNLFIFLHSSQVLCFGFLLLELLEQGCRVSRLAGAPETNSTATSTSTVVLIGRRMPITMWLLMIADNFFCMIISSNEATHA